MQGGQTRQRLENISRVDADVHARTSMKLYAVAVLSD